MKDDKWVDQVIQEDLSFQEIALREYSEQSH